MSKQYDNSSISKLKGADRVRLRPAVIFGSDDIEGAKHTFFEILSNSVDEGKSGYGNLIKITKHIDKSLTIQDFGRGIPLDWNENEQQYNWELVLCELYAGGKYTIGEGEDYESSLGTNGLGLASTQYASEFLKVISVRDGYRYEMDFEKGEPIGELQKDLLSAVDCDSQTGTTITYKPDDMVFTEIDIPFDWIKKVCQEQSVVAKGITFTLYDENTNEQITYYYEKGIQDYIVELGQNKGFDEPVYITGRGKGQDTDKRKPYSVNFELVFEFNNEAAQQMYFHNSSNLIHGGSPQKAVENAFVYCIDKYLKDNNKYNKGEKRISANDVLDSLLLISSSFSTFTSYSNQTKTAISNKFVQELIQDTIKEQLNIYFLENPISAEKITQQILVNMRSRVKAESTRLNIKKKLSEKISVVNKPKKFIDCRTKDVSRRELYIVEGDSALGSCKLGRNAEFQALMPVRGKILNCLKADYDKIFKSDIIVDLLKITGCGVEVKSKYNKNLSSFNIENINFSKICICTDGDEDGWQIRCLLLTMFYRLAPQLIELGYIYIADTPLYEITIGTGKNAKTAFAFSELEKNSILEGLENVSYKIQRSKGLGENTPEMMWETTMSPDTRRLIRVTMSEAEEMSHTFEMLLGDDIESRRQYIADYGYEYLEAI